jgi:hypothetical protein
VTGDIPVVAAGTESIVPMSEPAPEIEPLDLDLAPPMSEATSPSDAPTPAVPIESLDFDGPADASAPADTAAPAPVEAAAPIELEAPVELAAPAVAEDVAASEPAAAPLEADVPIVEPIEASVAHMERHTPAHVEAAPAPPRAERARTPNGQTARGFFAALAQRRALRPDGTLPRGMAAVAAPVAAEPATIGGGTIDGLFGAAPGDADDAMGRALATAVGLIDGGAAIRGRPTQAAQSELSLDSVFRKDSPIRTSGPVQRQSQVLKFDQFFSTTDAPDAAGGSAGPAAPATPDTSVPTDDAQFQSWLQGLKGQ